MKRLPPSVDDLSERPGNLPLVEALFEMRWVFQFLALVGLVVALRAFGPTGTRQEIDNLIGRSTSRTSAVVKTLWTQAGNVWASASGDR